MQPALVMQSLQETQSFLAECDVTRQRTDVKSGTGPSAAISMETNVQPNRQQQRIYTSTPINEFKKQHKSQQRNDAIGFLDLAKATTKRYIRVGGGGSASVKGQEPTFDVRLKALILLFGIIIIGYRIITLTSEYIHAAFIKAALVFLFCCCLQSGLKIAECAYVDVYLYTGNGKLYDLMPIFILIAFVFHLRSAPFQRSTQALKQPSASSAPPPLLLKMR